jgi:rhamnosyltransferase
MTIATIVVLYRPNQQTLTFVDGFACAQTPVIAVWNEFGSREGEPFRHNPAITLIKNAANVGLARALNIGIARAFENGAQAVFLLDQDSRPDRSLPQALFASRARAEAAGTAVGLIGPTLHDRKAGGAVNRVRGPDDEHQIVKALSTSGSLIDKAAFDAVGPMWEALFIDGIDHEWCYRAQGRGLCIVQSRAIAMAHDMGDAGINFFGRFKPIHRSPFRHYHIVRNSLWLVRLRHVPKAFSVSEIVKMAYRTPVYFLVSWSKRQTVSAIFRGVRDGLFQKPSGPQADQ